MAGGAAAAAAIAQAIRSSGVLVRVEGPEFLKIVRKAPDPLVVMATGGLFSKNYQYLMGYKGLAFYAKSSDPLSLPANAEVVVANRMWIP